ncbi:MAG TPA: hypothetical protein VL691_16100 [Vicinamibacteria bacterium]|nr:hypothetical protein [Vicinamibacteria bacterium]
MGVGIAVIAGMLAAPAGTGAASDLSRRLASLRSPAPVAVRLRLDLRLERTLHKKTAKGEASLRVEVEEDAAGLHVRWEPGLLRDANEEERGHDQDPDRLTPLREGMKELDPARLGHLLDQAGSLAGLTRGDPVEEAVETFEGKEARRLVFRFSPRLSWTEQYYLRRSDGRFTVWIAADGTPLASASEASFEGKTSRAFGRFKGSATVRTHYAVEGGRLRVAERDADERNSRDDGGEVEHVSRHFVLEAP